MTEKKPEELRAEFDRFDTDKNGAIDESEFSALVSSLGIRFSAEQTQTAFMAIDINGNRRIDFGEFKVWWSKLMK
jgi:Ca2+-binding EF-hand superfamily protein